MNTIWLDVPLPPTTNSIYANSAGGGRHKTKEASAWEAATGWSIRATLAKKTTRSIIGPYELHCYVNEATPGDICNREKMISDLLVSLRITDDDRHMQAFSIRRVVDIARGRMLLGVHAAPPGIAHSPPHDLT